MDKNHNQTNYDLPQIGHGMKLLQALNAAAASLQQSARSEKEVFRTFKEQFAELGLQGGLTLLDKTGTRLTLHAAAYTNKLLAKLEQLLNIKAESFEFEVVRIDVYRQVIETGKALFVDDNQLLPDQANPFAQQILKGFGSSPAIFAPLIAGNQVQGILNVLAPQLTPQDIPAMMAFANHIAIALENARLFSALQQSEEQLQKTNRNLTVTNKNLQGEILERERAEAELRRRNQELALLNRIIAVSATTPRPEPEVLLETTCQELALAFDVPQTIIALLDPNKTMLTAIVQYPSISPQNAIPISESPVTRYLLTHKTPLVIPHAPSDPRIDLNHDLALRRNTISLLYVPLTFQNDIIGMLGLEATEQHLFSTHEINLAWSVADQIAGALAHTRLTEAHQHLSAAIEQAAESVVITNIKGTILYVNPAFEQLTGYTQAEILGQNPRILKSNKQDAAFYRHMWAEIKTGRVWHGRLVNKKKDGTLYTEEGSITPIRNENGDIVNYVGVKRDVTHELQLEMQYRQSQKMEAIGQLSAGIAHDFNNLLLVINGFAELIQYQLTPKDPLREMADKILDAGQRAASLVHQLLAFSRKQIIEPKVLNLNDAVINMDKMLRRIIGENIGMVTSLTRNPWLVNIDPTQIEQIIINLAVNARDAMPKGGRLTIETANVVLDEDHVATHLESQPGDYVLLAISDTGVGISEEDKTHIFEPFFTTKEKGKGSGLGLATVFGIVKQNGGNIWVYSEKDSGTTFKIYLPRVQKPAQHLPQVQVETGQPFGTETILLVEDDADVRSLAQRVLHAQGYILLEAQEAQEALPASHRCHYARDERQSPGRSTHPHTP